MTRSPLPAVFFSTPSQGREARHLHSEPVHGGGRGDVETPGVVVAPGEVGRALGNEDHAEAGGLGREDVDAPGPGAVHVAGRVDLHAVRGAGAFARGLRPYAPLGEAAVGLGARHLARRVLAGEESALTVPGQAIGHVARLAEGRDAVFRRPAAEVVARHVAPEQIATRGMPERPLGEEAAAGDLLELDL